MRHWKTFRRGWVVWQSDECTHCVIWFPEPGRYEWRPPRHQFPRCRDVLDAFPLGIFFPRGRFSLPPQPADSACHLRGAKDLWPKLIEGRKEKTKTTTTAQQRKAEQKQRKAGQLKTNDGGNARFYFARECNTLILLTLSMNNNNSHEQVGRAMDTHERLENQ